MGELILNSSAVMDCDHCFYILPSVIRLPFGMHSTSGHLCIVYQNVSVSCTDLATESSQMEDT